MNLQEFNSLKQITRDMWIKMERWRLAYRADHTSFNANADKLKWTTVICAGVTGAASLGSLSGEWLVSIITAVVGVMTAISATIEKAFGWESKASDAWRNAKALEDLQSELYQYVWLVGANRLIEPPESFIAKINTKLSNCIALPCGDHGKFSDAAQEACSKLNFENMQFNQHNLIDEVDDDVLPEDNDDIQGIQPVSFVGVQ